MDISLLSSQQMVLRAYSHNFQWPEKTCTVVFQVVYIIVYFALLTTFRAEKQFLWGPVLNVFFSHFSNHVK